MQKLTNVNFTLSLQRKAKPVINMWNKETVFVKILWWHEILAYFCENIYFRGENFSKNEISRNLAKIDEISHFHENEKFNFFQPYLKVPQ